MTCQLKFRGLKYKILLMSRTKWTPPPPDYFVTLIVKVLLLVFLFSDAKVIILGDYAVGKTCLISRYIEGKFGPHESVCIAWHYRPLMVLLK